MLPIETNLGLEMVTDLSDDVKYFSSNSNCMRFGVIKNVIIVINASHCSTVCVNAVVMQRWFSLRHGNGPIVTCYNEHLETRYQRLCIPTPSCILELNKCSLNCSLTELQL